MTALKSPANIVSRLSFLLFLRMLWTCRHMAIRSGSPFWGA